jgi:hypothetical protein
MLLSSRFNFRWKGASAIQRARPQYRLTRLRSPIRSRSAIQMLLAVVRLRTSAPRSDFRSSFLRMPAKAALSASRISVHPMVQGRLRVIQSAAVAFQSLFVCAEWEAPGSCRAVRRVCASIGDLPIAPAERAPSESAADAPLGQRTP